MLDNQDNIMYFTNDDDFATFCINPQVKITTVKDKDNNDVVYYDYDFTPMYLDAVAKGTRFCIRDLHSHVNKDGFLGYGLTTKPIDNIERYYGDN